MKIIDRNGRLFGAISVIDVLVILVVLVMAAALYFKGQQAHTGTAVTEQTVTFQIRARGVNSWVADAILVGDGLYDQDYSSGGRALGEITDIQVERTPGMKLAETLGDLWPGGGGEHGGSADHGAGLRPGHRPERLPEPGV